MAVEESEEEKCWRYLLLLLERQGGLKFANDFSALIYGAMREEEMRGLIAGGWPAAGVVFTVPPPPVPTRGKTFRAKSTAKVVSDEYIKAVEEKRNSIIKKGNQS